MKVCPCGQPTMRAPQAKWCLSCAEAVQRRAVRRYMHSERGRASRRRYSATPHAKLVLAAWKERNPERVALHSNNRRPRVSTVGYVITCAAIGCGGTFTRTRYNGAQLFCRPCARASKSYSDVLSNLRYRRRLRAAA